MQSRSFKDAVGEGNNISKIFVVMFNIFKGESNLFNFYEFLILSFHYFKVCMKIV